MINLTKKCCLLLLAMIPLASVSFAAQSALSSAQIRAGNAADEVLAESAIDSGIHGPKRGQ
ncbi:MAG: hypothetical protein A2X31_04660 [Elusimicrobia bacterium GWB2_63_22]|nr:MAG: hypothetical protein A2X31_04660 [Elusimicrobia bacterium GWB2_63_22]